MSGVRWLLSPTGNRLHLPEYREAGTLRSACHSILSIERTDDHDEVFGVDAHERCRWCREVDPRRGLDVG